MKPGRKVIKHDAACVAIISDIVCSEDIGERVRAIRKAIVEARAGWG